MPQIHPVCHSHFLHRQVISGKNWLAGPCCQVAHQTNAVFLHISLISTSTQLYKSLSWKNRLWWSGPKCSVLLLWAIRDEYCLNCFSFSAFCCPAKSLQNSPMEKCVDSVTAVMGKWHNYCVWGAAVVALVCKSVSQHNWWKTEPGEAHSFTGTEVALPSFHSFATKEQQIVQISLIFAISGCEKVHRCGLPWWKVEAPPQTGFSKC